MLGPAQNLKPEAPMRFWAFWLRGERPTDRTSTTNKLNQSSTQANNHIHMLLLLSVALESLLHGRAGDRQVQVSRLQKGCGRVPAANHQSHTHKHRHTRSKSNVSQCSPQQSLSRNRQPHIEVSTGSWGFGVGGSGHSRFRAQGSRVRVDGFGFPLSGLRVLR